jgi:ribonuclease R
VIVPDSGGAEIGDRVLVSLDEWDDPRLSPEGEVVEVIGPADNPALDTLAVIKSYQLSANFPPAVVAAAEGCVIDDDTIAGRRDLRRRFIFTIDPETARDFDDALSLERNRDGTWLLGVHIADVSHFVQPGSELDREARERGTSVYLPDQVIPMLPEQLSNGLCSLVPNRDRLAFSVFVTLDEGAHPIRAEFCESVIHSRLRLTYEQAMTALELPEGAACKEAGMDRRTVAKLKTVLELTRKLRHRRFTEGALNMDLPEVRFSLGEDGRIDAVEPQVNDESHQLIEECMLLANEMVCRELAERGITQLHRIHEEPDPERLQTVEELLLTAGIVTSLRTRHDVAEMLAGIADSPQARAWNTAVLRAMKRARYSAAGVGHYGLAKHYYCHFTSPIRRYPDLVQHRLLKALLRGDSPPYGKRQIADLGEHCSAREDVATEAERDVVELKKLRFFAEQLASGELIAYDAVVTEVRNFGLMIDVPEVATFGMIHVSQLTEDFYDYDPARNELRGHAGGVYAFGDTVEVVIARVDQTRRLFDFVPVANACDARSRTGNRKEQKPRHQSERKRSGRTTRRDRPSRDRRGRQGRRR